MRSQGRIRLDEHQWEAARAEVGPVLIEGAPGSGKTTVLIAHAVLLLRSNVPARSIFFLTPNSRWALEMGWRFTGEAQRMSERISPEAADTVQKATIRDFAASLLRHLGTDTSGIPREFTLWSRRKTAEVIARFAAAGNRGRGVSADDIPDIMRWYRYRRSGVPEVAVPGIPSHWQEVMQLYEQEKLRENALNAGDMIPRAIESMRQNPEQLQAWRDGMMPHFLVDDFHNLTQAEYLLLQAAAGRDGRIMAAVDPNERVGSWRGADPSLPDRFMRDNPKGRRFTLHGNHRASQALHEVAFHLSRQGALTPLRDPTAQTAHRERGGNPRLIQLHGSAESMDIEIARYLTFLHESGRPWEDMAVLCRRHSSIDRLQPALSRQGIPHTISGEARGQGVSRHPSSLSLSTIHACQGREWGFVLILDASDDVIPGRLGTLSPGSFAEEERLFYVAVTRASEVLDVAYNLQGGQARVTRFVDPIKHLMRIVDIGSSSIRV